MVEYCKIFKMVISKILNFLRRLKISQDITVDMIEKVKTLIECYFLLPDF